MKRTSLSRRLIAVTATAALVGAGSLAGAGAALAAPGDPTSAAGISPSAASNAGPSGTTTSFSVSGTGFNQLTNVVKLHPTVPGPAEVTDITATVDRQNSTSTSLLITAPLYAVAPQPYDVRVFTSNVSTTAAVTCLKCLSITNPGRPTVTGIAVNGGGGYVAISGTNFAAGAKVTFLTSNGATPPVFTADSTLSFYAGYNTTSNGTTTHTSGYVGTTTINGQTSHADVFTAGRHYVKVTNTDNQGSTQLVEFWQPKLTTVAPTALGQGASNVPLTLNGSGIRAGSNVGVAQYTTTNQLNQTTTKNDVTVGAATLTGNTALTAPVSILNSSDPNAGGPQARTVWVTGPDGGFFALGSALNVTADPVPSSIDKTSFGQGAHVPVTVTGTGFKTGVVFSGGTGVTFSPGTNVALDGTTADTTVTVAPDAVVGGVATLTATNPDHGSNSVTGDGTPIISPYPFTIDAGPVITSVSPGGLTVGSTPVTITGTDFDKTNGVSLTSTSGNGLTFTNVVVSSATQITANAVLNASHSSSPLDVVVTNTGDSGSYTCAGCLGVNTLSLDSSSASNTYTGAGNTYDLTFTAGSGTFTSGTTFVLRKTVPTASQGDLVPAAAASLGNGNTTAAMTFDLGLAAPGLYNAIATTGGTVLSCTGCFTITGTPFTLDGTTPLSPATGGQGAVDFPITIKGTNFVHGEKLSIAGVTVSDTSYVSPTSLTATVTIPANATVGDVDAVITAADGSNKLTLTNGFHIVAAPTLTSAQTDAADTKSIGQGASNAAVHLVGTGLGSGSVLISGNGLTVGTTQVDATHLTGTVSVSPTAATGARDVSVVNTVNGGRSNVLVGAVVITEKPTLISVSPTKLAQGASGELMTFFGHGFVSGVAPVGGSGLTFTNVSAPASDGNSFTATVAVAPSAAPGVRHLSVANSDGGTATCTCDFTVYSPTVLTNNLPAHATADFAIVASGRLTNSATGAGLPSTSVSLTMSSASGAPGGPVTVSVITDANGNWSYSFKRAYNTVTNVYFPGDATRAASAGPTRSVGVATHVVIGSPKPASTSSHLVVFTVTGTTSPNKAGAAIYLFKVGSNNSLTALVKGTVASNGTYKLSVRQSAGYATYKVGVPATGGNVTGYSSALAHHFT